jgi:plastocyanin
MTGETFNPTEVNVGAGASVTFSNGAGLEHNVTFDAVAGAPANIGNHSSGQNVRVFAAAGTFDYRCTIHSAMRGKILVF